VSEPTMPPSEQLLGFLRNLPLETAPQKIVDEAVKSLGKEYAQPAERLSAQRKAAGTLQKKLTEFSADQRSELEPLVKRVLHDLEKQLKLMQNRFAHELAEQLKAQQQVLSGQLPTLQCAMVRLEIGEHAGDAVLQYGANYAVLETLPLDAAAAAKAISNRLNGGLGSGGTLDELFTRLQQAYAHARLAGGAAVLPIRQLLRFMALLVQNEAFARAPLRKHWRDYQAHDLSYDLWRLLGEPTYRTRLTLTVATRQTSRDAHQMLWIPGGSDSGGKTYSHLQINEA
jgi:hypothetical protein